MDEMDALCEFLGKRPHQEHPPFKEGSTTDGCTHGTFNADQGEV